MNQSYYIQFVTLAYNIILQESNDKVLSFLWLDIANSYYCEYDKIKPVGSNPFK